MADSMHVHVLQRWEDILRENRFSLVHRYVVCKKTDGICLARKYVFCSRPPQKHAVAKSAIGIQCFESVWSTKKVRKEL